MQKKSIELMEKGCIGCSLCQNVCPKQCISMQLNESGFWIPRIDEELCIDCGLCQKKCIIGETPSEERFDKIFFEARSRNDTVVQLSSSGGIFTEIAKKIFEESGIVFGVEMDQSLNVFHSGIENIDQLEKHRYSKYIQSNIGYTYKEVKKHLDKGKRVLFTGTPCQVFALNKYLNREYENLLTVDVLCFGIMSTRVFVEYVEFIKKENRISLSDIDVFFRKKKEELGGNFFVLERNGKEIYREPFHYSKKGLGYLFGSGIAKRTACFKCKFHSLNRCSDVTIGDFVKEGKRSDFNSSLVLINSEKGRKYFEKMEIEKRVLNTKEKQFAITRIISNPLPNLKTKKFFRQFAKNGFTEKTKKYIEYVPLTFVEKIVQKIICYMHIWRKNDE